MWKASEASGVADNWVSCRWAWGVVLDNFWFLFAANSVRTQGHFTKHQDRSRGRESSQSIQPFDCRQKRGMKWSNFDLVWTGHAVSLCNELCCIDVNKSFLHTMKLSLEWKSHAVGLTWELVYFWKNSTWKDGFIPKIDFTKKPKFEKSAQLMIQPNPRNTTLRYLIVVWGNGGDIAIHNYSKTVNYCGIKTRF